MNCKLMKILNDIILVLLEFVLNMIKLVIQTTGFYNLTFKFYSRSSALIALALLVNYLDHPFPPNLQNMFTPKA